MLDIYELALLFPILLIAAYWWRSSGQHSIAMTGARAYCKERGLQLLDESLVFRNYRIERPIGRSRRLCRVYEFDYSPGGLGRESGQLILTGQTILRIILHREVLEITDFQR